MNKASFLVIGSVLMVGASLFAGTGCGGSSGAGGAGGGGMGGAASSTSSKSSSTSTSTSTSSGGGVATCMGYCTTIMANCKDPAANQQYKDMPTCMTECAMFKKTGAASYSVTDTAANDFGCRMYHLSVAAGSPGAAEVHCPHVIPQSDPCQ